MTVEHRLLHTGSRGGRWAFSSVELTTVGLLLTAASLAMIGPLVAALLIHRSGAPGAGAATAPLILLTVAIVLALAAGIALFVTASRRR
ncbi:hypothetical protein [Nocardia sp. NPDC051833]|uniref:hypothetical protein n=1 Tax=Nocardia sp. NPDC051833 TaxID=3155674 RepID=UPI00343E7D9A